VKTPPALPAREAFSGHGWEEVNESTLLQKPTADRDTKYSSGIDGYAADDNSGRGGKTEKQQLTLR